MKNLFRSLGTLLPLLRYICVLAPDPLGDPSATAEFAVGGGSFSEVSRDCQGNVSKVTDYPYREVGGKVSVHVSEFTFGVAGGRTNARLGYEQRTHYENGQFVGLWSERMQPTLDYVTPSAGFETEPVGMEFGVLYSINGQMLNWAGAWDSRQSFSGSLRLGKKDKFHFSAGYAHNVPLISGGGLIDGGFSFPLDGGSSSLWVGLGAEPYDGLIFSFKADLALSKRLAIVPRLSFKSGDAFEYGGALGIRALF